MSSSPPGESPLTQHQPCLDALVIAAEQAAISSLRQPNRAYLKSSIVRPKVSHATLSKHRRRYREYPTEAAYHGRSSTLRKSRTFNLAPKSSSLANGEVETTQTKTPIGSNGRDDAVNAADSKLALGKDSCFLCLQRGTHQYTVVVNFTWSERFVSKTERKKSKASTTNTGGISVDHNRSGKEETQAQVMKAIQDAIYQQSGRWKRWLWCYEIRTAEEVKVSRVP
jgi:hypothetical protein